MNAVGLSPCMKTSCPRIASVRPWARWSAEVRRQREKLVVAGGGTRNVPLVVGELRYLEKHARTVGGVSGGSEQRQRTLVSGERGGRITGGLPFTGGGEEFGQRPVGGKVAMAPGSPPPDLGGYRAAAIASPIARVPTCLAVGSADV